MFPPYEVPLDEVRHLVSERALNGETQARFWLHSELVLVGGKKMIITKTCFIHVPAGVKHGGLCFRKIDRPVFQIAMSRMSAFSSVPPT